MKILNLYAGIGGNRKLWKDIEVTAVENDKKILNIYKNNFPKDLIILDDAHKFLLEHYKEYDFIWSSPPCQSHSSFRQNFRRYKLPNKRQVLRNCVNPKLGLHILKCAIKAKTTVGDYEK